jgi:hypothetical protein
MQKVAGSSPVFRSDRRPFLFRKGLLLFSLIQGRDSVGSAIDTILVANPEIS